MILIYIKPNISHAARFRSSITIFCSFFYSSPLLFLPIFHLYRCVLTSPPTTEKLKIDPFVYVERELAKEVQEDSDDEEEAVARG